MSANLDLVRSVCAPWERGDYSSTEWADPEIEYMIVGGLSAGSWTGVAAMTEASRDWISLHEDFHIQVDEFRELDDDRVLVLWNYRGRAKISGLDVGEVPRAPAAYLFDLRRGKVIRLTYYVHGDRALADLGLEE
jgi:hypothetical protein